MTKMFNQVLLIVNRAGK